MKLGGEPVGISCLVHGHLSSLVKGLVTDGVQHAPTLAPFPVWLKDPVVIVQKRDRGSDCTENTLHTWTQEVLHFRDWESRVSLQGFLQGLWPGSFFKEPSTFGEAVNYPSPAICSWIPPQILTALLKWHLIDAPLDLDETLNCLPPPPLGTWTVFKLLVKFQVFRKVCAWPIAQYR